MTVYMKEQTCIISCQECLLRRHVIEKSSTAIPMYLFFPKIVIGSLYREGAALRELETHSYKNSFLN